ncbi:hypothetical protein [Zunongwangia profunda]|uniref:hypothetical protein n=1 Tax=Zunongwangia profunda TaxID=398743 RepID=UPI001D189D53|nr:hypothetical protein [Zunongwangia profunda]MCC4230434.1 hypothetical protein [Zunongwangia profunda]
MKHTYVMLSLFFFTLFTNCGTNKNLQEEAPAQFQQAFYTTVDGQMTFYLPVTAIQKNRIELKNIYFKGLKSPIVYSEDGQNRYTASFGIRQSDYVMSSDPREEYGNKMPQKPEKSPVSIAKDQALLEFQENGETKYYVISDIEERK